MVTRREAHRLRKPGVQRFRRRVRRSPGRNRQAAAHDELRRQRGSGVVARLVNHPLRARRSIRRRRLRPHPQPRRPNRPPDQQLRLVDVHTELAAGSLARHRGSVRFCSLRKRQVLRTRGRTGLDSMALTRACATYPPHAETGREALVRRRATTTVMANTMPVRASVRSATFVTVIAPSVGATAASNANSSSKTKAARTLSRRQSQIVETRNRAAKTAAAA